MNLEYTGNLIPKMTSDTLPSGTASASLVYPVAGGGFAWKAFNHTRGAEGWHSSQKYGWLQYKFAEPVIINKYTLSNWAGYPQSLPSEWDFLGSVNGVDWVVLDSQIGHTFTDGVIKEYVFTNKVKYTYYRIDCKKSVSHSYVVIGELEMMSLVNHFAQKSLIKSQNKIHTLLDSEWTDITESIIDTNNISQEEYELYGMDSLTDLPMDILNQEDEFEVLTWSDTHEIIEKVSQGTEQVIDSGKMFKTTIEDFTKITSIEIL